MKLLARQNHAAEAAPLAVDMFRGRVDHAIRAERQGALKQRRREDIVDHERRPARVGDLGHGRNVDEFEGRVGRTFEKERPGLGPQGGAPLIQVVAVDQRRGDAEARQQVFDDIAAGAE